MPQTFQQDSAGRPAGIKDRVSHPYFMYDEIKAIPKILKETLSKRIIDDSERIAGKILEKGIRKIYLTECVTSYCAGIASSYIFNELTMIPSFSLPAFEIINYAPPDSDDKTAVFVISHRGRTKMALEAIDSLKPKKCYIVGLTDVEESPITRVVDDVSMGVGGEEPSYPKTRSWLGSVLRLALIALTVAEKKGADTGKLLDQLKKLPETAATIIKNSEEKAKRLAEKYYDKRLYVIGGGPNWATAQEGVLKLKEAGLTISEALEVEEVAHGPHMILDADSVVISIAPPGKSYARSCEIVQAANALGSKTISIIRKGVSLLKLSTDAIELDENLDELFTPIVYIIPMQLLSYYIALKKNLNPDANLLASKFQEAKKFLFPP